MAKNKVEVLIGGNIYSLQGEESNQHMQQVAALIDQKLLEIQKNYGTKRLSISQLYMLSAINIGDEYLKTKEELEVYIRELEKCNKENLALLERIEEMGLEINRLKTSLQTK